MEKRKIRKEIFQKRRELTDTEVKILSRQVFFNVRNYLSGIEKKNN